MSTSALNPVTAANAENRGYTVGVADLHSLGLPKGYKGTTSVVFQGTADHVHAARVDPNFQFDNLELDRLITVCLNREWQRKEDDARRGILMMGPTGSGKTTYIRQRLARQGIPLVDMTWTESMETNDALFTQELVGGDLSIAYAAVTQAAIGGYPVMINEFDMARPGQAAGLNEVIDTGRIVIPLTGEVIQAKRGFHVFATCNSSFLEDVSGAYAGTRGQNASLYRRFFKYFLGYPGEEQTAAFVKERYPDFGFAAETARFAYLLRQAAGSDGFTSGSDNHRIGIDFSRGTLVEWLDFAGSVGYLKDKGESPLKYALKPVFYDGRPAEEVASIMHLFDLAFGETV